MSNKRNHAIVLGCSLSGLLTAKVLSKHYQKVTIIEKDKVNNIPESRKGQPQTQHVHALVKSGLSILEEYFPDIKKDLVASGAVEMDLGDSSIFYSYGGLRERSNSDIDIVTMSRQLLEFLIRRYTLNISNIVLLDQMVFEKLNLTEDKQKIKGVSIRDTKNNMSFHTDGDLIIDTTGRGSRTPKLLDLIGFKAPENSTVKINVSYHSRIYKRDINDPRSDKIIVLKAEPPLEKVDAMLLPIEDDRWMLTIAGWHKTNPIPNSEKELLMMFKSWPHLDFYDILSNSTPVSEFITYKFPQSLRRHYEKLDEFPLGYLVLGDAVCSLNPVYGHGMTSAAFQAKELDKLLEKHIPENKLAKIYFKKISKIIDQCWLISTIEDFRYPETIGKRPKGIKLINRYMTRVHRVSIHNTLVRNTFLEVASLLKTPKTLFYPRVLWKLIRSNS